MEYGRCLGHGDVRRAHAQMERADPGVHRSRAGGPAAAGGKLPENRWGCCGKTLRGGVGGLARRRAGERGREATNMMAAIGHGATSRRAGVMTVSLGDERGRCPCYSAEPVGGTKAGRGPPAFCDSTGRLAAADVHDERPPWPPNRPGRCFGWGHGPHLEKPPWAATETRRGGGCSFLPYLNGGADPPNLPRGQRACSTA